MLSLLLSPSSLLFSQRWCAADLGLCSGVADRLYLMADVNDSGRISFEEFLFSVSVFQFGTQEQRKYMCFRFFGGKYGKLSYDNLVQGLADLHILYHGNPDDGVSALEQANVFAAMMCERADLSAALDMTSQLERNELPLPDVLDDETEDVDVVNGDRGEDSDDGVVVSVIGGPDVSAAAAAPAVKVSENTTTVSSSIGSSSSSSASSRSERATGDVGLNTAVSTSSPTATSSSATVTATVTAAVTAATTAAVTAAVTAPSDTSVTDVAASGDGGDLGDGDGASLVYSPFTASTNNFMLEPSLRSAMVKQYRSQVQGSNGDVSHDVTAASTAAAVAGDEEGGSNFSVSNVSATAATVGTSSTSTGGASSSSSTSSSDVAVSRPQRSSSASSTSSSSSASSSSSLSRRVSFSSSRPPGTRVMPAVSAAWVDVPEPCATRGMRYDEFTKHIGTYPISALFFGIGM